ncbi:putative nitroreductase [Monocercomonoides exilis]|uniref:putative nitroreductase n=1 Tax=Monocercomonoides exilis TaxID=2049356 RepID=UPI00355A5929|nr:putative nitroreductase [Monocercomonoides exilis]|eukprot:MONOS_4359.1-p1 / transcript=MONOS_4359.1 / gene=MONOS_4359 / organism=Monocercomonoides_exilis_PA203 / gene_product=nitroreductase / transcript_product=nitroreductase / location=Mono_scaffold00115:30247-30876(-) / protein_length=190 / sequence_SO=supercontig / SO=protein_coding / is_pseudo=false
MESTVEVLRPIQTRCSCRRYDPKPVHRELLEAVLESGRRAPSGKNLQPWHFYAVVNSEKNKEIGRKIQPILEEKVPQLKGKAEHIGVSNTLFYDSPVVIYITVKKDGLSTKYIDLGIAIENMMLQAEALGLCTLPAAMPQWFGSEIITKELGIPDSEEFVISLSLGYQHPSFEKKPTQREPLEKVVTFIE